MRKYEEISNEWEKDAKYNEAHLDKELQRIDNLLVKYHEMYRVEAIILSQREKTLYRTYAVLRRYYTGAFTKSDLDFVNRPPYALKVLRGDLKDVIESDDLYLDNKSLVDQQKIKIDLIQRILKRIENRGYSIKEMIAWHKWTGGMQ